MSESKIKSAAWPYLVFTAGEEKYAVDSSCVKEIVRNNQIYPVPFAPPYIVGIINCYSNPVAAVDWALFDGKEAEKRKEDIFLVLKDCEDTALLVSAVDEFKYEKEISKQDFAKSEEHDIFSGTISWNDSIIPLVDLKAVIAKIKRDLENE